MSEPLACLQVITPDLPDWEAEHQQWLSEYKQEYRKTYPPDWLDPKGTLKTVRILRQPPPFLQQSIFCLMNACTRVLRGPGAFCQHKNDAITSCHIVTSLNNPCTDVFTLQEGNLASVWKPAPRITEADKTGDVRTLDRKLDRRLLLLLKSPGWHLLNHGLSILVELQDTERL